MKMSEEPPVPAKKLKQGTLDFFRKYSATTSISTNSAATLTTENSLKITESAKDLEEMFSTATTNIEEDFSSSTATAKISTSLSEHFSKTELYKEATVSCNDSEEAIYTLIPFQPHNFNFPKKQYGNRSRSFLPTWFNSFKWLHYIPKSDDKGKDDAVTCFVCTQARDRNLFLPSQKLEKAFLIGFNNWKKCPKQLLEHEQSIQHIAAVSS